MPDVNQTDITINVDNTANTGVVLSSNGDVLFSNLTVTTTWGAMTAQVQTVADRLYLIK